jgi:nicotinate-nucleotide adenylyltransferase
LRVGILGGAFNPPHVGHLVGAQEALVQLELDKVVFMPVGVAPHRELEDDPGPEARLEMVSLAVAGDDRFEVSRAELDRPGPSYTADTLRSLRSEAPDDELFLILGGDQAAALPAWHEPETVLSLATVAVVERTNWSRNAIGIKVGRLPGAERIRYLDMPVMQISSSAIRRRVAGGLPIRYLVPAEVDSYIEANGLYRARAAGAAPASGAASPRSQVADASHGSKPEASPPSLPHSPPPPRPASPPSEATPA